MAKQTLKTRKGLRVKKSREMIVDDLETPSLRAARWRAEAKARLERLDSLYPSIWQRIKRWFA